MNDFKRFRKINKLTQIQIAEYFGCTQAFISLIERGESKLPKEYISKIKADSSLNSSMLNDIYVDDMEILNGIDVTENIIAIPKSVWDVIKNQAECLKIKDKESQKQGERIDRLITLLEKKIDNSSDGGDHQNKKDVI